MAAPRLHPRTRDRFSHICQWFQSGNRPGRAGAEVDPQTFPFRHLGSLEREHQLCSQLHVVFHEGDERHSLRGILGAPDSTPLPLSAPACLPSRWHSLYHGPFHFIADEGLDLLRVQRKGTRLVGSEQVSGTSALELCQLLVEVEDGAGGWLPFCGPVFADSRDAHALASRSPFPRASPTLRLRFQTPGQSPVETSIPNPGHRSSFPSLKPVSVPAVKESDRYRVELTHLNRIESPSPRLSFKPDFRHEAKPLLYLEHPADDIRVEDMQGNPIFYSAGYTLLPDHKLARILYTLRPQAETFPWNAADVTFIASGFWDETGKMGQAEINAEGLQLGFHKLTLTPSAPKVKHRKNHLPPLIDLKIEGAGDAAMWARVQALSPKLSLAIFSDESLAFGSMTNHGQSWGSHGKAHDWTGNSSWSGDPKPGSVFRVALAPETKPDEFEFIVDLSTSLQK